MKKELGSGKGSFIASVKVVLAMEREKKKRNKETTTLRRKTNKSTTKEAKQR